MAKPRIKASGQRWTGVLALLVGLCVWHTAPAMAQVFDAPRTAEGGTQFVDEEPPPAPKPAPARPAAPIPPTPVPATPEAPPIAQRRPPQPPPVPLRYPTVVFLLDTSDSMLNEIPGTNGQTKIGQARSALEGVIGHMGKEARLQLWYFNAVVMPVTLDGAKPKGFVELGGADSSVRKQLHSSLAKLETAPGTNLYQAVIKALDVFSDPADLPLYRQGMRYPVLVVISDGEDWGKSGVTLQQVEAAKKSHPWVTLTTIGFLIAKDDPWLKSLCQIASSPQGCATAENDNQLTSILETFYKPPAAK